MRSIFTVTEYQIKKLKNQSLTCFIIIIVNILISLIASSFEGVEVNIGSIDIVALVWIFILGIGFFKPSFKFMLSNGVSRKRFFLANIYCFAIVAGVWSIVVSLFSIVSRRYVNISVIYELIYNNLNVLSILIWLFAAFFLFATLGWFMNLIYYRSSSKMKLLISFVLFVASPLLVLISILTNGIVFNNLLKFFVMILGLSSEVSNPYVGAFSMVILAGTICCFNYLLLRKAQIKD